MKCPSYTLFSVVSNETRWKLIKKLYKSEMTVSDLCTAIDEEQSKVSHSLKVLLDCNLVFSRREGKHIVYSLNKKTTRMLIKVINQHTKEYCKNRCCKKEVKKK